MIDDLQLNVPLLRRRIPNITTAAKAAGLRPATVSNLCTGKIPVGRAEVRTLVMLASLAGCSIDELIIRGSGASMVETGIKVLDVFAPVVRGGTVGIVARPGQGQLVLLAELFRRMKARGYATVFWKPGKDAAGIQEAMEETDAVCHTAEEAAQHIAALRMEQDVMLGLDRSAVLSGEWMAVKEQLQEAGARPFTTVLVDIVGESVDHEAPYGPMDTLLRFDPELASRQRYPAVDPVASVCTLLEGSQLEAAHQAIQQRARLMLRRYRELRVIVRLHGIGKLAEADAQMYRRGERLEAYLTQPFYVAEPFTGKPGAWVALSDALQDVRRILDGAADHLEVDELTYIGRLQNNEK